MASPSYGEARIAHLTVAGDGVALHVARAGEGPPVILLHGFPENWRSWRPQIAPLLAAGFSVWIPDLRGYGLSGKPAARSAYAMAHLVRDVAALVRATGEPKAHVIGHDWGGVIAWSFAREYPELLDRLVILNAPHPSLYLRKVLRTRQIFRSWYVLFFQAPLLPEWLISAFDYWIVRRLFRRNPAQPGTFSPEEIEAKIEALAARGSLTAALNYYRANFLTLGQSAASPAVAAPTLVIWGERDTFLGPELLDGLEEYVPRLEIQRLKDAGHWVQNEKPPEVNQALVRFLTPASP